MKGGISKNKEYEFIKHIEGLDLKIHITCFLSKNKSLFHWHREIELLLVLDGPIQIYTENSHHMLETNDIFLVNSNEAHCIQKKTHDMNKALIIQIAPSFCNDYYPELKQTRFLRRHFKNAGPTAETWKGIYSNITDLAHSLDKKEDGYHFEIMSTINMIFLNLIRHGAYERVSEERRLTETRNMNRLNRIIGAMQEHFADKISLADLAEQEGLDMYYLSHFIKKYLGMSFQQYLNKLRLAKAVELLMKTETRNIDICFESGFSDYRYLCKAFVNEYGCTPSQFKNLYKEKYYPKIEKDSYSDSFNDQYFMLNQKESFKMFFDYLERNKTLFSAEEQNGYGQARAQ